MKVKCEYCDSFIEDTLDKCPNCGAPNEHMMRSANSVPKTIEELKEFCVRKNINTAQMHIHIDEDYRGEKAFGIYRDGENFIVYKNKAGGERAVRYRGTDEAYAVNELYQKMKEMVTEAKSRGTVRTVRKSSVNPPRKKRKALIIILIIVILALIGSVLDKQPTNGYYSYNGDEYCYDAGQWYMYGNGGWSSVNIDGDFVVNYGDYADYDYNGELYNGNSGWDWGNDDGYDYHANDWDNDDDWDDDDWGDDDWDSDWDFGGGDWDSDW